MKSALLERTWYHRYHEAVRVSRRIRHGVRIGWRRPLASWRALPQFIIIGAQKSGTSSLYAQLTTHPQVLGASWKEVHFFDIHFSKGLSWYRSHFPLKARLSRNDAITGEASPFYLYHPCAAARMAEVVPDVKLIVLLRNPVDRAISHYWHQVKRGRERLPLDEALSAEERRLKKDEKQASGFCSSFGQNHLHFSYKKRGVYLSQLKSVEKHFSSEQMMVIKSENYFQREQDVFDRVTRFLGLRPWTLPEAKPRNTNRYPPTDPEVRAKLAQFFEPSNQALYEHLGAAQPWWPAERAHAESP